MSLRASAGEQISTSYPRLIDSCEDLRTNVSLRASAGEQISTSCPRLIDSCEDFRTPGLSRGLSQGPSAEFLQTVIETTVWAVVTTTAWTVALAFGWYFGRPTKQLS